MAGLWGARKLEREQRRKQDEELFRKADAELITIDERIRTTTDELAYAEAELGMDATAELRDALTAVRTHLAEAFHLNQLNHDDIPDTDEELRSRNARIVQLCVWADELLDDRTSALASAVERSRRAPEIIEGIRAGIARDRGRLPAAASVLTRLQERYSPEALRKVAKNGTEAGQLLDFAAHGADVSAQRRASGQREQANLALETSIEAGRRASALLDAVDTFEIEALRAESTLDAVIDDSHDDLIAARPLAKAPGVAAAMSDLQDALASLPDGDVKSDPFASLTVLRQANSALDVVVDAARARAARPVIPPAQVNNAIDDADRQLAVARSVITGHRGFIGADARTRLAESERLRLELPSAAAASIPEDDREAALATARRCGMLAAEALQLAQRDIDSSRPGGGGWGGGQGGGGQQSSNPMGGFLGGLVIGSILDGMFN